MQEREPVHELPVEESLLPVIFPISKEACFEAGMFVSGLYGKKEATQKLLQQEANIGKLRDAFVAVNEAIEEAEGKNLFHAHPFGLGALYSEKAISIQVKENKIDLPTVHSMDVKSLAIQGTLLRTEVDREALKEHLRAIDSIILNSRFVTRVMPEDEEKSFQLGARFLAGFVAEVALKTPPDFKSRVTPQKSAFDLKPTPLTREEFEAILKKIKEEEEEQKS